MAGDLFHFDAGKQSFEDLGQPNGTTHWHESVVRDAFGYQTDAGFSKAMIRAKTACLTLGYQVEDHFTRQPDGSTALTRFGCYLVAMNGDPKKAEVAAAQAYFAALAATFQSHLEHADGLERLLMRDEITESQKTLSSTAKSHGVTNYGFFQNKGYMGMYNMSLERLCRYKGVPKNEKLLDRMNKEEMAAHNFRVTQTEAQIKKAGVRGQADLENTAYQVGKRIRQTMVNPPEDLPLAENVKSVRNKIKDASKNLKAIDKKAASAKKRLPKKPN